MKTPLEELDLHGLTIEQAIPLVEQFLEDSYACNRRQVWIVHGKGTGILRNEVRRRLNRHQLVKSCSPAGDEHGGNGATQVILVDW